MTTYEKLIKDGKVAVIVSPGFGAGWSTWNHNQFEEELTFDKEIVEALLSEGPEAAVRVAERKYPGACLLGGDQIKVEWVTQGEQFQITEYDGSETLVTLGESEFFTA